MIFPKFVLPFDSMSENFLLEQKMVKNSKINLQIKKTLQELIAMFYSVFGRACKVSAPAMFMAGTEERSYVQS